MDYREQTERIKDKLELARKTDRDLRVFGAASHKYVVGPPASEQDVAAFERTHGISLPACYRAFLTQVGNGGCSVRGSAAGPFYGIFPLNGGFLFLSAKSLSFPLKILPGLSDGTWMALTHRLNHDDLPNAEWDAAMDELCGGVLEIGSQGCAHVHGMLIAGTHGGRVVNIDFNAAVPQKPHFAHERDLLSWYERWLDEVISGDLLVGGPWFGYAMGGTEQELLAKYARASEPAVKQECLRGLFGKARLCGATLDELACVQQDANESEPCRATALELLTKHDYARARPLLAQEFARNGTHAAKAVFWYAKKHSVDWRREIRSILSSSPDAESFRFITYLAAECGEDLSAMIEPFTTHADPRIREQAAYALRKLRGR